MTTELPGLECKGIAKSFGGVPVLKDVSLTLELGTVTALVGENGAGKSTLLKIASGQLSPDAGEILVRGERLPFGDPRASHRLGVAIVPQELASIPDMRVYENLFVGSELKTRAGLLDRRLMIKRAQEMLDVFEVEIDPQAVMIRLPVGLRQIVEIVKNSSKGAKVLLLDEPTSAISEREIDGLYGVVRQLRDHGVAMVYTTHKMEEVRATADRVVVLRDGKLILDQSMKVTTDDSIVEAMIGRELEDLFPPTIPAQPEVVLSVEGLHVAGTAAPVSLQVRRGEILGLAGLVGAGRTELLETIFGIRKSEAGTVKVAGRTVRRESPAASISAGMALVPEDRKGAGGVLSMSVVDNGSLPRLSSFTTGGWLNNRSRTKAVGQAMSSVRLRSRGLTQSMETLSGGNQQKVVLARWLTGHVDVLLLDEPTRGVDVGARSEIYKIITELAKQGMAVIMASSDMPEILGMSHRAYVMRAGALIGELNRAALDRADVQATIFHLAAGLGDAVSAPTTPTDTAKDGSS